MKILRVGDPHVKPSNLEDSQKLFDFVFAQAKILEVSHIEILGDLFDTHLIIRMDVMNFWQQVAQAASKHSIMIIAIVGNHDMVGDKQRETQMSALDSLKNISPFFKVVNTPQEINGIAYIPYRSDENAFMESAIQLSEKARTLVCHQTFEGSKFDNGMYAPHGFNVDKLVCYDRVVSGHIHCFSEDTYFLTDEGWKLFDDISDKNTLISLDLKTEKLERSRILNKVSKKVDENLFRIEQSHVDQLITKDHTIIARKITKTIKTGSMLQRYVAKDLPSSFMRIPISGTLDRDGIDLSNDEIRLVVWLLADGSIEKKKDSDSLGIRWHLKKTRKIERLMSLLERLGIECSNIVQKTGKTKIRISNKDPYFAFLIKQCYNGSCKEMPSLFRHLNFSQSRVFLHEYGNTDGTFSPDNEKVIQIGTKKKREADIIQEMCHTNSIFCKISPKKGKNDFSILYVNIDRVDNHFYKKTNMKEEHYSGRVVCFTVNNGTLMIRRNGVVSVSGNCTQSFSNVFYQGTPKWDSLSDANQPKGIWLYEDDKAPLLISTEGICSAIKLYEISEDDDKNITIEPYNKNYIVLKGSSSWISKKSKEFKGLGKITPRPTDTKNQLENRLEKISSLDSYSVDFKFDNGIRHTEVLEYINNL